MEQRENLSNSRSGRMHIAALVFCRRRPLLLLCGVEDLPELFFASEAVQ